VPGRRPVEQDGQARVSLQQRSRHSRGNRAVQRSPDDGRFGPSGGDQYDLAGGQDGVHADCQSFDRDRAQTAERRRAVTACRERQPLPVSAPPQSVGRFIECDVPIPADAQDAHVKAAHLPDSALVARDLAPPVARQTVERVLPRLRKIHVAEEVTPQKGLKALRGFRAEAQELVKVEARCISEAHCLAPVERDERRIERNRCLARREAEH
jgi:hypothetical protein